MLHAVVRQLKSIAPGNPFLSDLDNMGERIGKDLMLMYRNHPNQKCVYLILVHTGTGERVHIAIAMSPEHVDW